jgi:integrase
MGGAHIVGRLKARQVANAKPPRGKEWAVIPDGGNLYLQATRGMEGHIRRSWLFKYELAGKRHELGLGPLHTISLAKARDKARALREQLLGGVDPLIERRKQRQELIAEQAKAVTFKDVAEAYLNFHLDSFRNPKHRQQWRNTLAQYAYPRLGHMTVAEIGPADVLHCIEPIWITKRETASRVRQRIERVLDYATAHQYRTGDNPAAHVTESLPKTKNGKGHHAALPYADLPAFMAELRARDSLSARALEFTVLCAARTNETIGGATWDEIDLKARVWSISAERMKAGKPHKVPLCERAVEILRGLDQRKKLFPLSNMGMAMLLKGMRPGITVHGFRSTFRDWAAERTSYPNHVVEMALAHAIGDKVEAAYRRGDLYGKRQRLMADWGRFCASRPAVENANIVVPLRKAVS